MAYIIVDRPVGSQRIEVSSDVQNHPLGLIVKAVDPTLGAGEFIYLKGVASTVVGSWVTYNPDSWTTALIVPDVIGPVAVAMSANDTATAYGWYQIGGKGSAASADVDSGYVYIDTVAGYCDDAVVAGDKVHNARWIGPDDTTLTPIRAEVLLARPFTTDEST
jgi:hypothetical protein